MPAISFQVGQQRTQILGQHSECVDEIVASWVQDFGSPAFRARTEGTAEGGCPQVLLSMG